MRSILAASLALGLFTSTVTVAQQVEAQSSTPVDEEIVIQGRRNLSRHIKKGFAAFRDGDFRQAESYFYRVRAGHQLLASLTFQTLSDAWSVNGFTGARGVYSTNNDREVRGALAIIHYMEGMSQRAQGENMSARLSFKRALERNAKHFDARADLALIEIENGKPEASVKHIKRLAKELKSCEDADRSDICPAIRERLMQVEIAYGDAVSG